MELWVPLAGAHIADIRKCQVSLTISNIQNSEIKFYWLPSTQHFENVGIFDWLHQFLTEDLSWTNLIWPQRWVNTNLNNLLPQGIKGIFTSRNCNMTPVVKNLVSISINARLSSPLWKHQSLKGIFFKAIPQSATTCSVWTTETSVRCVKSVQS